jgi:broad specificity phosphatase PhoE
MVDHLEVILMRHPASEYNRDSRIQGQRDVAPVGGFGPALYDIVRKFVNGDRPIDAVLTSDLMRANEPARMIADYLRSPSATAIQRGHPIELVETQHLREKALGGLEGASYSIDPNTCKATITLEEGKSVIYGGKRKTSIELPPRQHVYDFLYKLNNSGIGENIANIQERVSRFREFDLKRYKDGGKIIVYGHSVFLNYLRNDLVDDYVLSKPFKPLGNLDVIRLVKAGPRSPYMERKPLGSEPSPLQAVVNF